MDPRAVAAWEEARPGHGLPFSTACVAPWVSLELDPAGWAYACCANQTYPLGRVDEQRLPDLWRSPRIQTLRDALRRWDFSVGCQSCRWHLEHGRMDPDTAVYEQYPTGDPDPAAPKAMTFALSNRCNLGCVMCNPALSSTLRHEAGLPRYGRPTATSSSRTSSRSWRTSSTPSSWGRAVPDPRAPPGVGPHGRAHRAPRLQVTTNGTVWSDRVADVLDRFVTDVTLSIDAVTTGTYERIRRGARHADLLANLERFRAACGASGAELRFCFCLMTLNWDELRPYLAWADDLDVPVSINVVSDEGLALHDLPLADLDRVSATWAEQEAGSSPLHRNAEVWDTQLAQLEAVRVERRAGHPAPSKQPQRPPARFLTPMRARPTRPPTPPSTVADHHARLRRWSGSDEVAVIEVDASGTIERVVAAHQRLGLLEDALVGRPVDEVIDVLHEADGRPTWVLDVEDLGDHVVRVIGLSTNPVRGNPASIVRTITVPGEARSTLLVAEDRLLDEIHERPNVVSIPPPVRRPDHG